ncbi:MAG: hypothetical protein EBU43_07860 [Actinobacteria bacterium]|nr:hypothetical protein [Actinomycetota bacterium]
MYAGTTPQDYGVVGANNGVIFYSTPNEDLGYVIAHEDSSGGHNGKPGNVSAYVGFWRSSALTENSFVEMTNSLFNQNFTGGTECNTYLNANGYWTSYVDVYKYNPSVNLLWPSSTAGYTAYAGGITSVDDGYGTTPITLATSFSSPSQTSNQMWIQTNGYFTLGNPNDYISAFQGNAADLWLQPGSTNSEGDTENWWYKTGSDGGTRYYVKNIVYGGIYPGNGSSSSYLINLYIDGEYQWLETRIKSNAYGSAGINNVSTYGASTTSRVWRGSLDGQSWVYMGTGSIQV